MSPLYEKNMIVRFGFNQLTPVFINLLLSDEKVTTEYNLRCNDTQTLTSFKECMDELRSACQDNVIRSASADVDDFVRMRKVCERICDTQSRIYDGLKVLYISNKTTRCFSTRCRALRAAFVSIQRSSRRLA